ncbi:glycosyltransferase [Undibacterium arcticum]|uniref:glycosyltransferase n=1 Tax=Undibacterium arcticum TaxID=1762892 RepID=UPI00361E8248
MNEGTLLPELDQDRLEGRVFCCNVSSKVDLRAARQLAKYICDDMADIVVCTNTYSLLYGWLARIMAGRHPRLVEIFHTTEMGTKKSKLQMLFYRPFFRVCDMLVYVCEAQKKYWRSRMLRAKHDAVIHNGIDVEHYVDHYTSEEKNLLRQSYGFSELDYVVGLCASMRPEKAHGDLLKAIANLRVAGLDIKCLFIGDGSERLRIEEAIKTMGLAQHVKITGFLADARPAMATCNVMALVSHHVETFSLAALEAMALGKPMIMSEIGGAAEQVIHGENGYLYKRGDIEALADALHQLMESKKCCQMGDRARSMVTQRFSLATMVNSFDQLCQAGALT